MAKPYRFIERKGIAWNGLLVADNMTAEQKAKELVNTYYGCNNTTQLGAIEIVERVLLGTICERVDNLYGHIHFQKDYDSDLIESAINQLK